ncbi:MAG TPA: hypothetical protein VKA68_02330 [bacterium]|nr:hypothetical protein [bacterium]
MERIPLIDSPFEDLWEQHTIFLSRTFRDDGGFLAGGSGPGMGGGGPFPLIIRATLMDSALIEQGIATFAQLADLTPAETKAYRERYRKERDLGTHLYIWAEMYTRYHESYLNLDRWIFFVEDASGQQYEPVRVVEVETRQTDRFVRDRGLYEPRTMQIPGLRREPFPGKVVEFYFPRTSYYGKKVLSRQNHTLIFGAVNREDLDERAEGSWDLTRIRR